MSIPEETSQPVPPSPPTERSSIPGTGFFSRARALNLPEGPRIDRSQVRGYYIDFKVKAPSPHWPPDELRAPGEGLYVVLAQWALGCHERYLDEGDDRWLRAAGKAADFLLDAQEKEGQLEGAWVHRFDFPHTFPLRAPWISAMAQGEAASLLVRLHRATGRDDYADAARRALRPIGVSSGNGGALAKLEDRPFPEEYPTSPPSFVLNGAIFALWGYHDVGLALKNSASLEAFDEGVDTLARHLHRWDTGFWSRYDLFPHPVVNVASSAYHALHINQLRALESLRPRSEIAAVRARFEEYAEDGVKRARAFAHKCLFRMLVPRDRRLSRVLPWAQKGHD